MYHFPQKCCRIYLYLELFHRAKLFPTVIFFSPSGIINCILSASCNGSSIILHEKLLHSLIAKDLENISKLRMLFTWCLFIQSSNYPFSEVYSSNELIWPQSRQRAERNLKKMTGDDRQHIFFHTEILYELLI